jgi:molybdopterin-guanine dinucleotide biosynthesis protein A
LGTGLLEQDAELAVAVTGEGESRQPHPVFCMARISLLPHLSDYLRDGGRKIDAWYASLRVAEVLFPDENAFRNINTLDDLRKFEAA